MRQILADSQQNPRALMDHMKNPMVGSISHVQADMSDCTEDPEIDQRWRHKNSIAFSHFAYYPCDSAIDSPDEEVE